MTESSVVRLLPLVLIAQSALGCAGPPVARGSEPIFQYRGSDGCGNVFVYAWSETRKEVLSISWNLWEASGQPIPPIPPPGRTTFALSSPPRFLRVTVDLHPSADYSLYCTDVLMGEDQRIVWRAVDGHLSIDVGKNAGSQDRPSYAVTATLTDALFESPDGRRTRSPREIVIRAVAGRTVGG